MIQGAASPDYVVEPCPLCAAPIIWARTDRMEEVPLDAEPGSTGTHSLRAGHDGQPRAIRPTAKLAFGARLRAVHYTTCRMGKKLRERGRR
jgi:hypothetical protein